MLFTFSLVQFMVFMVLYPFMVRLVLENEVVSVETILYRNHTSTLMQTLLTNQIRESHSTCGIMYFKSLSHFSGRMA